MTCTKHSRSTALARCSMCERFVLLRAVAVHALPDVFMACEYSLRREIGSSSLYVLFSQCRSCDNALTSCFVQTSSYSSAHARIIYEKKIPVRPSLGKSINKLRQISRSLFELFFFLKNSISGVFVYI